jgi:hypothetical protein
VTKDHAATANAGLLGGGQDLVGKEVRFAGRVWTVTGRNYLGDWDVERTETRADGTFRISSTISSEVLPEANGHYAELVAAT